MDPEAASTSDAAPPKGDPYNIQHRPRQKAKPHVGLNPQQTQATLGPPQLSPERQAVAGGAGPSPLTREQVNHAYDVLEQRRVGPYIIKFGEP